VLVSLPAEKVLVVGKHFVGYGATEGGRNGNAATLSERDLIEDHLRPWRAFAAAGGCCAMAGVG
jgi:beta-glucosidase-like glycosyl hydrolase